MTAMSSSSVQGSISEPEFQSLATRRHLRMPPFSVSTAVSPNVPKAPQCGAFYTMDATPALQGSDLRINPNRISPLGVIQRLQREFTGLHHAHNPIEDFYQGAIS